MLKGSDNLTNYTYVYENVDNVIENWVQYNHFMHQNAAAAENKQLKM